MTKFRTLTNGELRDRLDMDLTHDDFEIVVDELRDRLRDGRAVLVAPEDSFDVGYDEGAREGYAEARAEMLRVTGG